MGLDGVLTVLYISVVGLIFVSVMVIATAYDVIVIRWIKHKQAKFQGYSVSKQAIMTSVPSFI